MCFSFILVVLVLGATGLSAPERILVCPGGTAQYHCYTSLGVNTINWNIYCPGQLTAGNPLSTAVGSSLNRSEDSLTCTSGSSEMVTVHIVVTYESKEDRGESNISLSVIDANYSISGIRSLTLECNDDSENYRFLDFPGLSHK